MSRVINGVKLLADRRQDPKTGQKRSFGTKLVTPAGETYRVFEYPQRIADVRVVEHGIVLALKSGSQRLLQSDYDQLKEAACASVSEEHLAELLTEAEWDEIAREALAESDKTAALQGPDPHGKPGGPGLWGKKGMELPHYIQHIRDALMRSGHSEGSAIAIARAAVKRWGSGRGKVHPEVRAAAGKADADWDAKRGLRKGKTAAERLKDTGARTREAAGALKAALRNPDSHLQPLLETWLAVNGDSRPVSGEPEELREAAIRASTGNGTLNARSDTDRRVLQAQRRAQEANMQLVQPDKTRRPITESMGRADPVAAAPEAPRVFVQLPPERGSTPHAQIVMEGTLKSVGEITVGPMPAGDLEDLKEQAEALYVQTEWTPEGRAYLHSAGRREIGQIIHTLKEALAAPLNSPDLSGEDESITEAGVGHNKTPRNLTLDEQIDAELGLREAGAAFATTAHEPVEAGVTPRPSGSASLPAKPGGQVVPEAVPNSDVAGPETAKAGLRSGLEHPQEDRHTVEGDLQEAVPLGERPVHHKGAHVGHIEKGRSAGRSSARAPRELTYHIAVHAQDGDLTEPTKAPGYGGKRPIHFGTHAEAKAALIAHHEKHHMHEGALLEAKCSECGGSMKLREDGMASCEECGTTFKRKMREADLQEASEQDLARSIKCPHCGWSSKKHTRPSKGHLKCANCGRTFTHRESPVDREHSAHRMRMGDGIAVPRHREGAMTPLELAEAVLEESRRRRKRHRDPLLDHENLRRRRRRRHRGGLREADSPEDVQEAKLGNLGKEFSARAGDHHKPEAGHGKHGFHNLGPTGKERNVHAMSVPKLKYFAGHKRTHPELRKRVRHELRGRTAKVA